MDEQSLKTNTDTSPAQNTTLLPAVMHKRFLNFLIDYYVAIVLLIIFYIVSSALLQKPVIEDTENPFTNLLYGIVVTVIYYTFFETMWGKTPGKYITHTKVVTKDGKPAEFPVILKRSLLRIIPFEALSFLKSKHPDGWHDRFAGTIVIDERSSNRTTRSAWAILGLMIVQYISVTIAYFIVFLAIIILTAFTVPKDTLDKISPAISPSPAIQPAAEK